MNEDKTFRKLKQIPFNNLEVFFGIDHQTFEPTLFEYQIKKCLESCFWTAEEYIEEHTKRYNTKFEKSLDNNGKNKWTLKRFG